jgi:glucokinase
MTEAAIVAVDLGGTKLASGKVQHNRVVNHASRPIPPNGSEEAVLNELIESIRSVFDEQVVAIGVGVPSVVDVDRGIVYTVQNIPSWKEVHLKEKLEAIFRVPVYVNNDANCFVLGECHFGKGRGFRNIVGLTIGTGLGGGIIIDRRLYSGTNCGAGEIGMIPYKDEILEYYCSGQFFSRKFGVGGEVVFQRAISGDPEAVEAYHEFGTEMGHAVITALYAYDPEIVILGGSVSKAYSLFKKNMLEKLETSFAYQHTLKRLVINTSDLSDSALLGAAALYLDAMEKKA